MASKVPGLVQPLCPCLAQASRAATFAWEMILAPIARTARAIGRQLLETIRLALRAVRFLLATFQRLTRAVARTPAGLAIQTSIIFGRAILRSPPPAASAASASSWPVFQGIIAWFSCAMSSFGRSAGRRQRTASSLRRIARQVL